MQLKDYQRRVLDELGAYLDALARERQMREETLNILPEDRRASIAKVMDFAAEAWKRIGFGRGIYRSYCNGLGEPMPDVYLKVPTGGGKTLLACHAVDAIRRKYLRAQAGLAVWIVPTNQIYRQTLAQLRDRSHPYRQLLENSAAGRVLIAERNKQRITRADIEGKLVVLLLMLPAAARKTKETLRMYRDSGGYDAFFPDSGDAAAHIAIKKQTPNADAYQDGGILPPTVKSSLANVMRISRPLIVVDEGQKAYSENARETICGFNPSFVLELSATPPESANIVASAIGRELNDEEMIKLDVNLVNRDTADWKCVLLAAVNKRRELEKAAEKHRQNSGRNIRPIALIQTERVGKDQRGRGHIHAEDARELLLGSGVAADHIAVKTSEQDDLEGVDLLDEECPVRYIITKQALQEGWDCSFAYVLAVLSGMRAQVSLTQIVGRVLRQPYARKTGDPLLDQCYVFTHRRGSGEVVKLIKEELEKEGLGDLHAHINSGGKPGGGLEPLLSRMRPEFKPFAGRLYFPQFVAANGAKLRLLEYERDILARLDWEKMPGKLTRAKMGEIALSDNRRIMQPVSIGLPGASPGYEEHSEFGEIDPVLMTRQFLDVVPNAWRAHALSLKMIKFFRDRDGGKKTAANFVFLIEEGKKMLAAIRDEMAEAHFHKQIAGGEFELLLFSGKGEWRLPSSVRVAGGVDLIRRDNGFPWKKSLLDPPPGGGDENRLEKAVAFCLDEQARLLWWYRNHIHGGYRLQGWRRGRIYPDFIAASAANSPAEKEGAAAAVRVIEIKGKHLQGSEDTLYKKSMLELCDKICREAGDGKGVRRKWGDLGMEFPDREFSFHMVDEAEWESAINDIFSGNSAP